MCNWKNVVFKNFEHNVMILKHSATVEWKWR